MMHTNVVVLLLLAVIEIDGDVYMHNPPGGNNRLNGQNRDRRNNNRLFDSQNNNRGGYNVGGDGNTEGAASLTYTGGSQLNIQWTNQHECGSGNTGCDIILQYMCDELLRDGTSTQTISESVTSDNKANGRHESQEYYADCKARRRDDNLYNADQNLDKKFAARFTRQNKKGQRSGLECPEERDYYPYHAPTPWKDIAILTNNVDKCELYRNHSQNVQAKGYCKFPTKAARNTAAGNGNDRHKEKKAALTPGDCADMGNGMQWTEAPAHGLDPPDCIQAPVSRDNHLGNTVSEGTDGTDELIPKTLSYTWTVPDIDQDNCVLRIRYNISVGDYDPFATTTLNDKPKSSECLPTLDIGSDYGLGPKEAKERGYEMKNNPRIKPLKNVGRLDFQLAINTAQTGRTFQDRSHKFRITKRKNVKSTPADAPVHNLNVIGKRGNIVQVYPAVEYGFEPANLKVQQGHIIHAQWTGSLKNPQNNDGEGRKGEDKSNMILMTERTYKPELKQAATLGHPGNSYPLKITKGALLGVNRDTAQQLAFPKDENNLFMPAGSLAVPIISMSSSSVFNNDQNRWGARLGLRGMSTKSTGYFHSKRENYPWLRLQMEPTQVSSITIINRIDNYGERLRNVEIRAGETATVGGNPVVATFVGPGVTKGEHFIPFTSTVTAKYMTIRIKGEGQYLQVNGIRMNEDNANFEEIGCFNDRAERAITGDFIKLEPAVVVQKCANKAKKAGNKIFAVQYNFECFTDAIASEESATQTYAKYGSAAGCANGRGGTWRQTVYKIVAGTRKGTAATLSTSTVSAVDPCEGKREYSRCNHYDQAKAYYCRFNWLKNNCCRYCQDLTGRDEEARDDDGKPAPDGDHIEKAIPIEDNDVDENGMPLLSPEIVEKFSDKRESSFDEIVEDVESNLEKSEEKLDEVMNVFDDEVLMEREKRGRRGGDAAKLDQAPEYVNVGFIQANTCETYNYVCTRNNNFSNRSQKGKVTVEGC